MGMKFGRIVLQVAWIDGARF